MRIKYIRLYHVMMVRTAPWNSSMIDHATWQSIKHGCCLLFRAAQCVVSRLRSHTQPIHFEKLSEKCMSHFLSPFIGQTTWKGTLWFVETKLCFDWLRQSCVLRKTLNGGSGLFLIATQMMVNKNQGTVESHSQLLWNFVLGLAKCV